MKTVQPDGAIVYTPFPNYEEEIQAEHREEVPVAPPLDVATTDQSGWTLATSDATTGWTAAPLATSQGSTGWTTTANAQFPATSLADAPGIGNPRTAGRAMAFNNLASGGVTSEEIAVTGGEEYVLQFWIRGTWQGAAETGQVAVEVEKGVLSRPETIWSASQQNDEGWRQVEAEFYVDANVNAIRIKLAATQISGWVAFDDLSISMIKGKGIPLPDPGFERGEGWMEVSSLDFPATSIWRGGDDLLSPHEGHASYIISNLMHTEVTSPALGEEILPEREYLVTAQVQGTLKGPGKLSMIAVFLNEEGEQLWEQEIWSATHLDTVSWEEVGDFIEPVEEGIRVAIRFRAAYISGAAAFDNVCLKEAESGDGTCWGFEPGSQAWHINVHPAFPAGTGMRIENTSADPDNVNHYALTSEADGRARSDFLDIRAGQRYNLRVWVRGDMVAGSGDGQLWVVYYNKLGEEIGREMRWHSNNFGNPGWTKVARGITPPAGTYQVRLHLEAERIRGWLAFDDAILTAWSDPISVYSNSTYALSAVANGAMQAPAGEGGRLSVRLSTGETEEIWASPANFNSSGTTVNGTFETGNAASIRVKTDVHLNNGWLSFSDVTLQEQVEQVLQRSAYTLAGQPIATRLVEFIDGVEVADDLYYVHTDHLGSTSLLSYGQGHDGGLMGAIVPGSEARYKPFGDWRTEPTTGLTDRGFTGHKHNNLGEGSNNLGLIYMNARYYAPGIGRFASADTIEPDSRNPQAFNRYSYTFNNPLLYTDPSGHRAVVNEGGCVEGGDTICPDIEREGSPAQKWHKKRFPLDQDHEQPDAFEDREEWLQWNYDQLAFCLQNQGDKRCSAATIAQLKNNIRPDLIWGWRPTGYWADEQLVFDIIADIEEAIGEMLLDILTPDPSE